jgi:hypothetical protein
VTGPLTGQADELLPVRVSPGWLALREPADAAARASDLVEQVRHCLPAGRRTVIHDLACGTGSMGRWLAPRLTGEQHWVMYDRDAELLDRAAAGPPRSADGVAVTVATRQRDITRLEPAELAGASLITVSALLDMLTADELHRFVSVCSAAGCPVLVTLSVIGRVALTPADRLDSSVAAAFNAHQRRTTGGRRLLGPDAVGDAAAAFRGLGAVVVVRPSPWRLGQTGAGGADASLIAEWFTGWLDAACEQRPELTAATAGYRRRRLDLAGAGRLGVTVHHQDLLVFPP